MTLTISSKFLFLSNILIYIYKLVEQKAMVGGEKIGTDEDKVEDPGNIQKFENMLNQGVVKKRKNFF